MNVQAPGAGDRTVDRIQNKLVDYAIGFRYEDLTPQVIHTAKARIIDSLGVLIGGFFGEPCRIMRNLAAQLPTSGRGAATVMGTRMQTSPEMAALVNGTTARLLEFNDVYHWPGSAHGHPSDVVTPLLAAAEHAACCGRNYLEAIVLAYEVFGHASNVFDKTVYCNTNIACLATAVGAAKLLRLDPGQVSHCIAMAVVPNNILIQVRKNHLSMWKEIAAGYAGRAGVFAAIMARAGLDGPHLPFEGKAGWAKNVGGERFSLEQPMGGKGTPYRILATRIKIRPCEGLMISSVLAAEKVAPLRDLDKVSKVIVETNQHAQSLVGSDTHRPVWNPDSREVADHSIPYVVAAALLDGKLTLRSYDDAHLWGAPLRSLLTKIEVVTNEEYTAAYQRTPREHRGRVTVIYADGRRLIGESGGDEDDLSAEKSDARIEEKFRELTEDVLGAKRVRAVLDRLWNLEQCDDVGQIPQAFVIA